MNPTSDSFSLLDNEKDISVTILLKHYKRSFP